VIWLFVVDWCDVWGVNCWWLWPLHCLLLRWCGGPVVVTVVHFAVLPTLPRCYYATFHTHSWPHWRVYYTHVTYSPRPPPPLPLPTDHTLLLLRHVGITHYLVVCDTARCCYFTLHTRYLVLGLTVTDTVGGDYSPTTLSHYCCCCGVIHGGIPIDYCWYCYLFDCCCCGIYCYCYSLTFAHCLTLVIVGIYDYYLYLIHFGGNSGGPYCVFAIVSPTLLNPTHIPRYYTVCPRYTFTPPTTHLHLQSHCYLPRRRTYTLIPLTIDCCVTLMTLFWWCGDIVRYCWNWHALLVFTVLLMPGPRYVPLLLILPTGPLLHLVHTLPYILYRIFFCSRSSTLFTDFTCHVVLCLRWTIYAPAFTVIVVGVVTGVVGYVCTVLLLLFLHFHAAAVTAPCDTATHATLLHTFWWFTQYHTPTPPHTLLLVWRWRVDWRITLLNCEFDLRLFTHVNCCGDWLIVSDCIVIVWSFAWFTVTLPCCWWLPLLFLPVRLIVGDLPGYPHFLNTHHYLPYLPHYPTLHTCCAHTPLHTPFTPVLHLVDPTFLPCWPHTFHPTFTHTHTFHLGSHTCILCYALCSHLFTHHHTLHLPHTLLHTFYPVTFFCVGDLVLFTRWWDAVDCLMVVIGVDSSGDSTCYWIFCCYISHIPVIIPLLFCIIYCYRITPRYYYNSVVVVYILFDLHTRFLRYTHIFARYGWWNLLIVDVLLLPFIVLDCCCYSDTF